MSAEKQRLTALVRGRVQGVGFRAFAARRGRSLGLSGYARNLGDYRTVEVVAEGERSALEELLALLRRGPVGAHVDDVDAHWSPAQGDLGPFDVRY
ncbi:MAG TPA: acylphosphatase [Chloroflexota bacterium]|nr:acylphosphatase [Chloroflexota bacterium]